MTQKDFHFYRLETSVYTQRKEFRLSISKCLIVGILGKSKTPCWETRRWPNYLDETGVLSAVAMWGVLAMRVFQSCFQGWQWVGWKLSHDQFPLFLSNWLYDVRVILCSVCLYATENHILTSLPLTFNSPASVFIGEYLSDWNSNIYCHKLCLYVCFYICHYTFKNK